MIWKMKSDISEMQSHTLNGVSGYKVMEGVYYVGR
jgi:hypothetical protein